MFGTPSSCYLRRLRILPAFLIVVLVAPDSSAFRRSQQSPTSTPTPQTTSAQGAQGAQGAPGQDQDAVVRINTQLVQVDAVVTDKKGVHVDNLAASDFELQVDGKPQSLSHFALIRLPVSRRTGSAEPKRAATNDTTPPTTMPTRLLSARDVKRTIAFVVDDLGLSFQSMFYVREAEEVCY